MKTKLNIPPEAMKYMTVGIEFAGVFMVVLFIGILLDRKFGFTPLFVILGMVGGFAGAMYCVMRTARQYELETRKKRDAISDLPDESEPPGSDAGDCEAEDEFRGGREG